MFKAATIIMERSPVLRRSVNRAFYQYLAKLDDTGDVTLMNYGYVDLNPGAAAIPMTADDEENRLCLQLYHHIAGAVEMRDRDVLEVGSGRGGGAAYVKRTFSPRSMTGVDYSERAVAFCQQAHLGAGVDYHHGDAEALPFDDASFDVVINVESSHCYGVMSRFLSEVYRVLRPGGHLSWADLRSVDAVPELEDDIRSVGFEVVEEHVITPNVVEAMKRQGERNSELINRKVPPAARWVFNHFAGVEGSQVLDKLRDGRMIYLHKVMRKPAP